MIHIHGIIGNQPGETSLLRVIERVKNEPNPHPHKLHVLINSIGGDLDVAFAIYNYLRTHHKEITTECTGTCASAASILFLAGTKRIAGCPIMIHNPYIQAVNADANTLHRLAQWIEEKEIQAEQLYAQRTQIDQQTLSQLMDNETYLAPTQAVTLGFATEARQIARATLQQAPLNPNPNMKKTSIASTLLQAFAPKSTTVIAAHEPQLQPPLQPTSRNPQMNTNTHTLTTTQGVEIHITSTTDQPQLGDQATPDGTHTLPSGDTITIQNGTITNITPAQDTQASPTLQMQQHIAHLQAQVENLHLQMTAYTSTYTPPSYTPSYHATPPTAQATQNTTQSPLKRKIQAQKERRETY